MKNSKVIVLFLLELILMVLGAMSSFLSIICFVLLLNSVIYLDLNEGAAKWADYILATKKPKTSSIKILQKAGYDMTLSAKTTQDLYVRSVKNE